MALIEHGGRREPEYTHHYIDHRLNAVGNTLEEAYIALARNVNRYYNFEGNPRDDRGGLRKD